MLGKAEERGGQAGQADCRAGWRGLGRLERPESGDTGLGRKTVERGGQAACRAGQSKERIHE